jgi:hypothetical protein
VRGWINYYGAFYRSELRFLAWAHQRAPRSLGHAQGQAIQGLIGQSAPDQEAAMSLLAVIPDLAGWQLRGVVARWLHDLYPVPAGLGGEKWIGQLQPDLIAERLVVHVLGRHRRLISGLFARWLDALGVALFQLGRPAEALPVTQEAVTIRRELAAASPTTTAPTSPRH